MFFTTQASAARFYLDNGQTALLTLDVQDSLDASQQILFRDNTGLFYALVVNSAHTTVYGLVYDPIGMTVAALDPINSATFGQASDFCIKSISSNNDPNFLETTLLSRCDSDQVSTVVVMAVNSSGATLSRQFVLASTTIDKLCSA